MFLKIFFLLMIKIIVKILKENGIAFKISFIGNPLSWRKTQAEILNKKYTHFKIYSVYDILKDKNKLWNEINEPLENNPKFKTMKPNQIDSLKEEDNEKIEEFKSENQLIISYLENNDEIKFLMMKCYLSY